MITNSISRGKTDSVPKDQVTDSHLSSDPMIRAAAIEDLPDLLEIEAHAFEIDRISRRNFRHLLTRANAISLVDEERGHLCGYVTVLFKRGTSLARLYSIAVHPRCRGRGKGGTLLDAAEQESRGRGLRALRLEVHPDNAAARDLYARHGFLEIGSYERFYEDGSDAIRLEKRLRGEETNGA